MTTEKRDDPFELAAALIAFALIAWGLYELYSLVSGLDWSHGLRGVVLRIWCGPKGCE